MSIEKLKSESSNVKTSNSYTRYTKYGKAYTMWKFDKHSELTQEFIKAFEDAITTKDPQKFKQITKEFGQFIPTKCYFRSGRVHYDKIKMSTGSTTESSLDVSSKHLK